MRPPQPLVTAMNVGRGKGQKKAEVSPRLSAWDTRHWDGITPLVLVSPERLLTSCASHYHPPLRRFRRCVSHVSAGKRRRTPSQGQETKTGADANAVINTGPDPEPWYRPPSSYQTQLH